MTLLPNKHIPTNRSLVGIGALVLGHLERPTNVSRLWNQSKTSRKSRVLGTSCCRSTISLLLERLITNADC